MNAFVITIPMAMLLINFWPYGIMFMTVCVFTTSDFPVILHGS
jgi:L-cystine uptake protein TcyP (sodium:dicarboxylate symporter family)